MFVPRIAVSLPIPDFEKKSLVKITTLVYNSLVIGVFTMDKVVRTTRKRKVWIPGLNQHKL